MRLFPLDLSSTLFFLNLVFLYLLHLLLGPWRSIWYHHLLISPPSFHPISFLLLYYLCTSLAQNKNSLGPIWQTQKGRISRVITRRRLVMTACAVNNVCFNANLCLRSNLISTRSDAEKRRWQSLKSDPQGLISDPTWLRTKSRVRKRLMTVRNELDIFEWKASSMESKNSFEDFVEKYYIIILVFVSNRVSNADLHLE